MKTCIECLKTSEKDWNGRVCEGCKSRKRRSKNPEKEKEYHAAYSKKRYIESHDKVLAEKRAVYSKRKEYYSAKSKKRQRTLQYRFSSSKKRALKRNLSWTLDINE